MYGEPIAAVIGEDFHVYDKRVIDESGDRMRE
jgi:hypothetical protein